MIRQTCYSPATDTEDSLFFLVLWSYSWIAVGMYSELEQKMKKVASQIDLTAQFPVVSIALYRVVDAESVLETSFETFL